MRSFDFRSRSLAVLANLTNRERFSGLLPFTATFRVNERLTYCIQLSNICQVLFIQIKKGRPKSPLKNGWLTQLFLFTDYVKMLVTLKIL